MMANQSLSESLCITLSHSPIVYHQSHNHIFSYCHVSVSALTILYLPQDNLSLVSCLHHYPLYRALCFFFLFDQPLQKTLSMETSVTCYSRGVLLPRVSSQRSSSLVSPPSFSTSSSFKVSILYNYTYDLTWVHTQENVFTARLESVTTYFYMSRVLSQALSLEIHSE